MNAMRMMTVVVIALLIGLSAHADIPLIINHQGTVKVNGVPYTGSGLFKFGFYNATGLTWLWTNDGYQLGLSISQAPINALTVDVDNGHYSVRLGDTDLGANMKAIPSSVFNGDNILLRVYVDDGVNGEQPLLPDQPITSGAYAFHAHTADTVPGYINGGMLSNSTGDAVNDLDITALICRDDQNRANIEVAAMTKRVDDLWAAGDGNGGLELDAGSIGDTQVLVYVWAIGDSTGQNAGDILFSKSGVTPGLPSGYDLKRFIGARLWQYGVQWIPFRTAGAGRLRKVILIDNYRVAALTSTSWTTYSFAPHFAAGRTSRIETSVCMHPNPAPGSGVDWRLWTRLPGGAVSEACVSMTLDSSSSPSRYGKFSSWAALYLDSGATLEYKVSYGPSPCLARIYLLAYDECL